MQEACEAVEALRQHYIPPSGLVHQSDIQDLAKYMARPRALTKGTLPTVDAVIYTKHIDFPDLLGDIFGGMNKVRGAYGMRFTIVFTLQVAATPFQQGVVVSSFQYASPDGINLIQDRAFENCRCTNIPHVRLDISSATMSQLKIPFLASTDFLPLTQSLAYGSFYLNMLLPVGALEGMAPPTYALYIHLEDIELFGARPETVRTLTFQSGKSRPFEKEFDTVSRPFSTAAYALSGAAKLIAKGIPAISSIAGPASWMLDKAASVIRYFGYSRPQIVDPPTRILNLGSTLEHNVDMATGAVVLAPFASNHLAVSTNFTNSDVDEMSLAYVLGQYNQLRLCDLTTSVAAGTLIYGMRVSPRHMWFRRLGSYPQLNIDPPSTTIQPTGAFWFSSMFEMWRGSFKFRFTFAKTKMHAGRVLITYIPNETDVFEYPESDVKGVTPSGYSLMCDLKDSNVFEFLVPYTSHKPYCNFGESIGTLSVVVVDPLLAPGMVSSSITYLVEVACDSDYELARPAGCGYVPNYSVITQSGVSRTYKSSVCEDTVGECFGSLKQLIMLPKSHLLTLPGGSKFTMDIMPWYYYTSGVGVYETNEANAYGGAIASAYAFVRGATDIHVYHSQDENAVSGAMVVKPLAYTENFPAASLPLTFSQDGSMHARCPSYQHVVRMPSYAFSSSWNLVPDSNIVTNGTVWETAKFIPRLFLSNLTAGNADFTIRRQAADDAALTHYIGPPSVRYRWDLTYPGYQNLVPVESIMQGSPQEGELAA